MNHFTHLTQEEKDFIRKMLSSDKPCSLREIARKLGRSASTISREIRRNPIKGYNPQKATKKSKVQKSLKKDLQKTK